MKKRTKPQSPKKKVRKKFKKKEALDLNQEAIARNELLEEDLILSTRYEENKTLNSAFGETDGINSTKDWFKYRK